MSFEQSDYDGSVRYKEPRPRLEHRRVEAVQLEAEDELTTILGLRISDDSLENEMFNNQLSQSSDQDSIVIEA